MATKKPSKSETSTKVPAKTKLAASQEISDDELEAVSGGMMTPPTTIGPYNPGPTLPGPTNPFPEPDLCFTA